MRFFVINTGHGYSEEQLRMRVERMKQAAAPDTEIEMECLEDTDICIDSQLDVALASPEIIQKAIRAEQEGYDAIGIYCTSDPALWACREAVSIPVIGGGIASFAIAMLTGCRISFLTTAASRRVEKEEFARSCGIDPTHLASVRSVEYDLTSSENSDKLLQKLIHTARLCREQDGADVIILGCLSFAGMGKTVEEAVGVPAIDPAYAMVSAAEAMYRQKLCHSKVTYADPPPRKRSWGAGIID